MWFATGSLDPNMVLSSNRHDAGLSALSRSARRVSRSIVASALDRDVGADQDESDDGGTAGSWAGAVHDPRRALPAGGIVPGCSANEVESELQGGGEFWTGQARSTVPTSFPRNVFTNNLHGAADPLALGPTGDPVNLPAPGPAGNWCRPPATPMSETSPLVTRAFWIMLLFPTAVLLVFGLSRGFRLRPVSDAK